VSGGEDLFAAAAETRLSRQAPLAARLRPRALDEVVGQAHLVAPGAPLRVLVEADRLGSVIFWGPAGTGKTTLARVVAETTAKDFVSLSAVTAGVKDVREALEGARRLLGEQGRGTILFVDEVHRFNKTQQDVLLPAVEEGLVVLIGATTENPFFEVNAPLLSRATLWRLEPLSEGDLVLVVERGLKAEAAEMDDDALAALVAACDGDARAALTTLEVAVALCSARLEAQQSDEDAAAGPVRITMADMKKARDGRLYHQGADDHYDQVSALIKSVRGSDPDAGLYWMVRMLEAGEDARFVARRLVILASEDIGMADPDSLLVAEAAARAVEMVGLPEATLNLAQAVVHLSLAPKSNRVTLALGKAQSDVANGPRREVPAHLRDAHYSGATTLGHGDGYRYPHDDPTGWVDQQYRPAELEDHLYYEPSDHGRERDLNRPRHQKGESR
jgi:putative ATPase